MALVEHQDLSNFNTLAIQAEARFYWAIQSLEDLQAALDWYRSENVNMPLLVLGCGSNLILSDHFPGLVLHMQNQGITLLEELSDLETVYLDVAAGENWHELVCHCCEQGWYGLENLALIPGAAGAAPIQNIGAYGVELCDVMDSLECLEIDSGKHYRLSAEQCEFAYRDSIFKQAGEPRRIISRIRLRLCRGAQVNTEYPGLQQSLKDLGVNPEQASPKDILQAVCKLRRANLPDPAELPNVGSFFKNPIARKAHYRQLKAEHADLVAYPHGDDYKLAAGWLIDQAGWRGHREEQVAVHERQALVLVNYNKGSAKEVLMVAKKIQDDIWQRYHVALEIEPRHILASGELAQD